MTIGNLLANDFSEIHLKKPFPNLSTVNCQPNSVDKSWTIGCQLSTVHGDTLKSVSPVDSWLTDDADTFAPVVNCQDHVHHHFFARQHRLCESIFSPTRKYWQNNGEFPSWGRLARTPTGRARGCASDGWTRTRSGVVLPPCRHAVSRRERRGHEPSVSLRP